MNRRDLLKISAGLGVSAALSSLAVAQTVQKRPEVKPDPAFVSKENGHPICPVCMMEASTEIKSEYKGKSYFFCEQDHKLEFDDAPGDYLKASQIPQVRSLKAGQE